MDRQTDLTTDEAGEGYWNKQFNDYIESGLSMKDFCQQRQLRFYRFQYRFYKCRKNKKSVSARKAASKSIKTFMPVSIQDEPSVSIAKTCQFSWQHSLLHLECSGLTEQQVPGLIKVIGDWYAQSINNS